MDGRELIRTRLTDLDRMAYERGILRCSGFLSYAEQSEYHLLNRNGMFRTSVHFLEGGYEDAERAAAFFLPDYMEREDAAASEIAAIKASAVNDRFADELTHRDYLGALMNLGIERDCIGDILTEGSNCIFFCSMEMADYITENLLRVKHTSVRCSKADRNALNIRQELEELQVNVASERIDAVIAAFSFAASECVVDFGMMTCNLFALAVIAVHPGPAFIAVPVFSVSNTPVCRSRSAAVFINFFLMSYRIAASSVCRTS